MVKLYITEYGEAGGGNDRGLRGLPVAKEPAVTSQVIDFTTSAPCDDPFNKSTRFVRLWADAACFIKFGDGTVAATANDQPLAANVGEFRAVEPGGYVAAYDGSS